MKIRVLVCLILLATATRGAGALYEGKPASHWLKQLESADVQIRSQAVAILGELGPESPELIDAVKARLKDRDPGVRSNAVWALGRFAVGNQNAAQAFNAVIADLELRETAFQAVHDLHVRSATRSLRQLIAKDNDPRGRVQAAHALAALPVGCGGPFRPDAIYEAVLKDAQVDESVQLLAMRYAAERGVAAPLLVEHLVGASQARRGGAEWALVRMGPLAIPALVALLAEEVREDSARLPSREPAMPRRQAAAHVLSQISHPDATAALVKALSDKDETVRFTAALAVPRHKEATAAALPILVAALKGNDPAKRDQALVAIGRHAVRKRFFETLQSGGAVSEDLVALLVKMMVGKDREARYAARILLSDAPEPVLRHALKQLVSRDDPAVRISALRMLQNSETIGDALPVSLVALLEDRDDRVRQVAFQTLNTRPHWVAKALPTVVASLKDRKTRVEAAGYLAALPEHADAALPILQAGLDDSDLNFRLAAARAILILKPTDAAAFAALRALVLGADERLILAAVQALPPGRAETQTLLRDQLQAQYVPRRMPPRVLPASCRVAILHVLGRKEAIAANVTTIARAASDADAAVRCQALAALGDAGPRSVTAANQLATALADSDVQARHAALAGLARLGDGAREENVSPALRRALDDKDPGIRIGAAPLLAKLEPSAIAQVVPLLGELSLAADPFTSDAAVFALLELGADARPAIPRLLRVLARGPFSRKCQPPNTGAYAWAIQCLARQGKHAVPALLAVVADDNAYLRNGAIQALGEIGPEAREALPALRAASDDRSPAYREPALEALKKIEGATPKKP